MANRSDTPITVRFSAELLGGITTAAEGQGISRTAWLKMAAESKLRSDEARSHIPKNSGRYVTAEELAAVRASSEIVVKDITPARRTPKTPLAKKELAFGKKEEDCNHNFRRRGGLCPSCGNQR